MTKLKSRTSSKRREADQKADQELRDLLGTDELRNPASLQFKTMLVYIHSCIPVTSDGIEQVDFVN